MCQHRDIIAVDQRAGIAASFGCCETGGRIKLDNDSMILLGSGVVVQEVIAELVQQILGWGRTKVGSVQQKPKV